MVEVNLLDTILYEIKNDLIIILPMLTVFFCKFLVDKCNASNIKESREADNFENSFYLNIINKSENNKIEDKYDYINENLMHTEYLIKKQLDFTGLGLNNFETLENNKILLNNLNFIELPSFLDVWYLELNHQTENSFNFFMTSYEFDMFFRVWEIFLKSHMSINEFFYYNLPGFETNNPHLPYFIQDIENLFNRNPLNKKQALKDYFYSMKWYEKKANNIKLINRFWNQFYQMYSKIKNK